MSNEIEIRTVDDAERLARIAVTSGFTSFRRVEEAVMVILTGRELGLSPMQTIRGIYVVSGKPVLSADLMVAVVRRSGLCESWRVVESTAERCTITTRRRGEEHDASKTWTIADAKRAGITGKGTWNAYPSAMLRHRCAADLARQEYPDVLMGLYDPEELDAEPAHDAAPDVSEPHRVTRADIEALGIEHSTPTLPAPSRWSDDLAECETLRDVRAAYSTHATPGADTFAMRADVAAWCAARWICLDAAGITAMLSTLPEDALAVLEEAGDMTALAAKPSARDIISAARRYRVAAWDDHSRGVVRTALGRGYAKATGAKSIKDALALLAAATDEGAQQPAQGDATGETPSDTTAPAGAPAEGTAWRENAAGIDAHVAALKGSRHTESSARTHLREIPEALRLHAIHTYARRVQAMSEDGKSKLGWERCVEMVEGWLREGPIKNQ